MDINLLGFLEFSQRKCNGLVTTDRGKVLTDYELRMYCRWGVNNGYKLLSELPEYEIIDDLIIKLNEI